ncbi:GEVED domain-containing protein [uncultured Aquimarina sp.]|uniref:GEVED domain-containing protein n=1 Tax=uncultured Aquimarina sp. TaxID=575652 RepID=UPI00261DA65B|nr:GEVED domain-containing protein [uncultured Aquimarina sp.]
MQKHLLLLALIVFYSGFSQTNNFWKTNEQTKLLSTSKNEKTYNLDFEKIKNVLIQSPKQDNIAKSGLLVTFPNEFGEYTAYRMIEKSNLHPDLAKKFPNIKSYVGSSANGTSFIYISLSSSELSGMIIETGTKTQFIKSQDTSKNVYQITSKSDNSGEEKLQCGTVDKEDDSSSLERAFESAKKSSSLVTKNANDATLRTYRFALATTAEFSNFYINRANVSNGTNQQKKAAVLEGLNAIMTKMNAIYQRDLSVRFQLVANNDAIIFLNTNTDGFTSGVSSTLVNEAHGVITNTIGNSSFDIGHVVDLSNQGGFGGLGVVCNNNRKGEGASTALDPTGNFFEGLFLHEIGHQLGASHTFNNFCNGNRANFNAVEPGSGSSIMSYSGVCAPNVINSRDTYFHAKSIEQMWNVVSNNNCATTTNTGNSAPTANAGRNFTIPKSTPFVLNGSATDANTPSSQLTYTWEQMDVGIEGISSYIKTGPSFRSSPPSSSSERYFPAISGVASGFVSDFENLPAVSREMNFRLTVRDNHSGGGNTASDNTLITVNDEAGPFVVTSPNTNEVIWRTGTNQNITWDVAGTTGNGINVATVNILLSTDGGNTFNTTLASNVPNDGAHQITVPNSPGALNRIMVRGVNHVFYDMSNESFFITNGSDTQPPSTPIGLTAVNPQNNSNIAADLNWTAATDNVGIAGYIIVQDGEEIFTWNSQSPSIIMRGLDDGAQYSFQVIAFDAAGNKSDPSAAATVTTTGNAPTAPKNVIATNITQTGFSLSWNPSTSTGTNIDGYSVLLNGTFILYTKDVTPNNLTSAVITGLDPGRVYSVEITAVDGNNIRSRKNSIPIEVRTIEDNIRPTDPTNVTASEATETTVKLNWIASTDNTRVAGYIIVQNGEEVFTWNSQDPEIVMRSLTPGTQYTYQIIAFDAGGLRSNISASSATITTLGGSNDTTPPSNVTNVTASNITSTTATLTWNAATDNVGVTSYDIFRNQETTAFQSSTTNSFELTGLTPESTTTYFVKAKDAANNVSLGTSNVVTVTTLPGSSIAYCNAGRQGSNGIEQVTFGTISNTSTNGAYSDFTSQSTSVSRSESIVLTVTPIITSSNWSSNVVAGWIDWNQDGDFTDADEQVLLKPRGTGGGTATVVVPATAQLGETRLRVRYMWFDNPNPCGTAASDGDEVEDYSIVVSDGTQTNPPTIPTNLVASEITQTSLVLNWGASTSDNSTITGYEVYRDDANGNPILLGTTDNAATTTPIINLGANTTFSFFVIAVDANGLKSQATSKLSVTTLPLTTTVNGGTVATSTNETQVTTITNDGIADLISFTNSNSSGTNYRYLITDNADNILAVETTSHDFEGTVVGICKVYGIAYEGTLNAVGKNITNTTLASDSFDVSNNSIEVNRTAADVTAYCAAGRQGNNGIGEVTFGSISNTSTNNGYSDFTSQSTNVNRGASITLTVTPIITSSNWSSNVVAGWIDWNRDGDFTDAGEQVLLKPRGTGGGTATVVVPATAQLGTTRLRVRYMWFNNPNPCGTAVADGDEVEDYSIVVDNGTTTPVNGGTVATSTNATQVTTITNDGIADLISFTNSNSSGANYSYLITDNADNILAVETTSHDFEGTAVGICKVYGIAYEGTLNAVGKNITNTTLASDSFDVSNNSIEVNRTAIDVTAYCEAGGQGNNGIGEVTFGSISNTSTNNGYSDFTSQSTTAVIGTSITLTVTPIITSSNWSSNVVAGWIDWNQDGDFTDAGEQVLLKPRGTGGGTATVVVPATAQLGTTRLRVRYRWFNNPNPCGTTVADGDEVEDYSVVVSNALVKSRDAGALRVFPNPFENTFTIDVTKLSDNFTVSVFDLQGRKVIDQRYNKNPSEITLGENLRSAGVYFIHINSGDQNSIISKIMKK